MKNILIAMVTFFLCPVGHASNANSETDPVRQCTVRSYLKKRPAGDYFNYAPGTKVEVCADAINQCLVDGFILADCRIIYFGSPFGDE